MVIVHERTRKMKNWKRTARGWEMLGMMIQRERWAGKLVFLCYADTDSAHGGANFATCETLPQAKQACEDLLTMELIVDAQACERAIEKEEQELSDCCCAPIWCGICSECKEHCEPIGEEK